MRRRVWPAPVLLVLGAASALSAKEVPRADDAVVAAHAASYSAFRLLPATKSPMPPAFATMLRQLLGADFGDARALANLTVDHERSIVVSLTIVDPARLEALIASPEVPTPATGFGIRNLVVVPVTDPARALAALDQVMPDRACARPGGDAKRWAAWLAELADPGDRRAAQASDAAYLCVSDISKGVVTVDRARREIRWVTASGNGSLLTAASEKLDLDRALADRLRRDGFFSLRAAMFTTPIDDARAQTALELSKMIAGLSGVTADQRPGLWKQGARELGAARRLIESPPVLLAGMLGADGTFTWTLTDEGRKFFGSLRVRPGTSVKSFKALIAAKLKPAGAFRDPEVLDRTVQEGGSMTPWLIRHALWPHAIAFAAAHPGASPLATFFDDENATVEVDAAAGRVRLRSIGAIQP